MSERSRGMRWAFVAMGVAIVASSTYFVADHLMGTAAAEVGSCVALDGDSMRVLDCGDPAAKWRVVGKIPGQQMKDVKADDGAKCAQYGAARVYFEGISVAGVDQAATGPLFCLGPK